MSIRTAPDRISTSKIHIARADNLFATERSTVPSDGMAEALLLAAFARQKHLGGELFARASA